MQSHRIDHDSLKRLLAAPPAATRVMQSRLSPLRLICAVFLPEGYPSSTSSDYISYQLWDTAQAVCSSAVRVLTTEALLKSVGVGDSSATALGATLQFVSRDLLGKFSRVFFCAFKGSEFDRNPKRWRLVADATNDINACCDLLMPLAPPSLRVALVCMSSICGAICGISGAATRSSLTQHFALKGNFGDIAAKDDSQEMAVGIVGLCLGMLLVHAVAGSSSGGFAVFALLTLAHLACNYKAVCSVRLTSLSDERMGALVRIMKEKGAGAALAGNAQQLPTPEEVRRIEGVIICRHTRSDVVFCSRDSVGCSAVDIAIVAASPHSIVFTARGSVHVAAVRDCRVDALLHAAFVAYCHAESVTTVMSFEDFCSRMTAAGWSLTTHQLRLGDHVLHSGTEHDKSS